MTLCVRWDKGGRVRWVQEISGTEGYVGRRDRSA